MCSESGRSATRGGIEGLPVMVSGLFTTWDPVLVTLESLTSVTYCEGLVPAITLKWNAPLRIKT